MASAYTELTKEAKQHGGPDKMRENYMLAGAAVLVAAHFSYKGLKWGVGKATDAYVQRKADRAAATREADKGDDGGAATGSGA